MKEWMGKYFRANNIHKYYNILDKPIGLIINNAKYHIIIRMSPRDASLAKNKVKV